MKYTLILAADPDNRPAHGSVEQAADHAAFQAFNQAIVEQGAFVAGEALQPAATARTVSAGNGEPKVSRGSAIAGDHELCGIYIIDCASDEDALAWATNVPLAAYGTVEVRPCIDYTAMA